MSDDADRRVARSKRALRAALTALLKERDYDSFTVDDLIARADVGRSTFYSHYHGKDDLLRASLRQLQQEVRSEIAAQAAPAPFAFSQALLAHIEGHRELYRRLKGRAQSILLAEFGALVAELIRETSPPLGQDGFERELAVHYLRGGYIAALVWWLEKAPARPAAEIDRLLRRLLTSGPALPDLDSAGPMSGTGP